MKFWSELNFRGFLQTLDALKLSVFLCLAFAVFVILPDQSLELYRYTAQSLAESYNSNFQNQQGLIESVILVASACLLTVVFLVFAASLRSIHQNAAGSAGSSFNGAVFSLIACAPCLAVAWGLVRARIDTEAPNLESALMLGAQISFEKDIKIPEVVRAISKFEVSSQLQINQWLLLGTGTLILLAAMFFVLSRVMLKLPNRMTTGGRSVGSLIIALGLVFPVLLSVLFAFYSTPLGRSITAFGIVCLFFGIATLVLAALTLLQTRTRFPILFLLIVCAFVFNIFGWNDNHGIRELGVDKKALPPPPLRLIGDGFKQWLEARKDFDPSEDYPVYVVAAEGGGIYAAFRTATFLTTLQDICPRFSRHLFAISSVSGGSIGAAIFAGLTESIHESDDKLRATSKCLTADDNVGGLFFTDVAEDILRDDYLSPVLAAFLFPDFLQRFLPFPIPFFDRSRALENSLETSWNDRTEEYKKQFPDRWARLDNPFEESFAHYWSPQSDTPALFFNTTEVESGRGRVIAPLAANTGEISSFPLMRTQADAKGGTTGVDIRLSTAAVLSARFPWLTPPGSFLAATASGRHEIQLVDGGYLDNSGVITALTIVREMEHVIGKNSKVQINLIILTSGGFAQPSLVLRDYFAPFQTLISMQQARGHIAIEQAEQLLADRADKMELQGHGYPLPLGWRLSPITRLLILGQNGDRRNCESKNDDDTPWTDNPDCLKAKIYQDLSNDSSGG
jgi:hypothetical protein